MFDQNISWREIFRRASLNRHGITTRVAVNSIANRTLISDETNKLIRDMAPGTYVREDNIFPSGVRSVGIPHFLSGEVVDAMEKAAEKLSNEGLGEVFRQFSERREAAIIEEIRAVCGIKGREPETMEAAAGFAAEQEE